MSHQAPLEIERVFLLARLPEFPTNARPLKIEQGYLPDEPADGAIREGRLRHVTQPDGSETFIWTVKRGVGMVREEREQPISREEFSTLWPRTAGRRLRKTRYRVPVGELTWEVDAFEGIDVVLAEVEIPAADATVELPSWLAPVVVREVTDEPEYRNYSLAVRAGAR